MIDIQFVKNKYLRNSIRNIITFLDFMYIVALILFYGVNLWG